ncbi:F-box domain-containing protein [Caenorhabditis elegans]|uniref:F-box domain-containing protein n=1 Tax=Caenorhabditis elegans TaxID=6239 RepID=Q95Y47_CAEEL|nr:F-box domain-containing protein [Caenorhabditis elegans]CCD64692.1 F-box domain-containing protein [Caenorhabditis elegans]|eukprot:NP_494094.1 F-box B protein [Caenorhabditis elegans]
MSAPSFPILRLPSKALHATLQTFDFVDLMSFSLISPTSVRPLNTGAASVYVILDNVITIVAGFVIFYLNPPSDQIDRIKVFPQCRWLNESFSVKKCVENLLVALDLQEVEKLVISKEHVDCDELKGFKFKMITMNVKNLKMFDLYYRDAKEISIADRAIFGEQSRALFSENLDCLEFLAECVIGLDDIIASNAIKTNIARPFSFSNLNLFLRHFINGSNPSLKEMNIAMEEGTFENYEKVLLNGINYRTSNFSRIYADGSSSNGLEFQQNDRTNVIVFVDPIRRWFYLTTYSFSHHCSCT